MVEQQTIANCFAHVQILPVDNPGPCTLQEQEDTHELEI